MSRGHIVWLLRQLLPLHYRTSYLENGRRHHACWRMWLGHCFAVTDVVVAR
jgi:hypothetical protein